MEIKFNENGKFHLDEDILIKSLKLRNEDMVQNALEVARETSKHVKPKYIFAECPIQENGDGYLRLQGIEFKSSTMAKNLKDCDRVFPYIVTCGSEVSKHSEGIGDVFDRYVSEKVEYLALTQVREQMRERVSDEYGISNIAFINPGSIQDWSTAEVKKIFELLNDKPGELGLEVLDSGMINPVRSGSGFMFVSADNFENCILCRRDNCPNRKADFDEEAYINSL